MMKHNKKNHAGLFLFLIDKIGIYMSDHSDKEKDNQLDDKKYKDEKIEKRKSGYFRREQRESQNTSDYDYR